MSSSIGKDVDTEHVEIISALEKVFAALVAEHRPKHEQISQLAAIILDQDMTIDPVAPLIIRGKKALQLLEIIRRANARESFLAAKKLLWGSALGGWTQTEEKQDDRRLFADAILNFSTHDWKEADAFGEIFRGIRVSRWLVCRLLARADKDSNPVIVAVMIRSVLRDVMMVDERLSLVRVSHLMASIGS